MAYRTPAPDSRIYGDSNNNFYFALYCRTLTVVRGYIQSQFIGRVAACAFIAGF